MLKEIYDELKNDSVIQGSIIVIILILIAYTLISIGQILGV